MDSRLKQENESKHAFRFVMLGHKSFPVPCFKIATKLALHLAVPATLGDLRV